MSITRFCHLYFWLNNDCTNEIKSLNVYNCYIYWSDGYFISLFFYFRIAISSYTKEISTTFFLLMTSESIWIYFNFVIIIHLSYIFRTISIPFTWMKVDCSVYLIINWFQSKSTLIRCSSLYYLTTTVERVQWWEVHCGACVWLWTLGLRL